MWEQEPSNFIQTPKMYQYKVWANGNTMPIGLFKGVIRGNFQRPYNQVRVLSENKVTFWEALYLCALSEVFSFGVLFSVMTYESETCTLTESLDRKFRNSERRIEISVLGISLLNKKSSRRIRKKTKVDDMIQLAHKTMTMGTRTHERRWQGKKKWQTGI